MSFRTNSEWIRLIVMGILLLLLGRYFLWRLFTTLKLDDIVNGTLSISLLVLEVVGWILGISSLFLAVFEGDRVIYLNEALSAGLAAENIGGYIDQRLRWGQGTIQSLFSQANPFTLPGLNLLQRFIHGLGVFYWFQSAGYIVFLCLPLAYFWWGISPIQASLSEMLFFFVPYYFTFAFVFGQPNQWQAQSINEAKSAWSLISSIFRIYPLTRNFNK